jgi:hypothetical protein
MKDLTGSPPTTSVPTNNDGGTSQTPPAQRCDGTPHSINPHVEQTVALQTRSYRPLPRPAYVEMSYQGVDLTVEAGDTSSSISWQ